MRTHSVFRRFCPVTPLLLVALAACAGTLGPVSINGVPTPRVTQEFIGQPYSIRHTDGYPRSGSPSDGTKAAGGNIAGTICGADIQYQVTHDGDRVRVSGFINNEQSATLEIREANHIRRIQGALGNFAVDVLIAEGLLAGSVGRCRYELRTEVPNPELFTQLWRTQGYTVAMRINGQRALSELPAADQAALVPILLYCATAKMFENFGHDPPVLGFGGTLGSQPPRTINFGTQGGRYCGGLAASR